MIRNRPEIHVLERPVCVVLYASALEVVLEVALERRRPMPAHPPRRPRSAGAHVRCACAHASAGTARALRVTHCFDTSSYWASGRGVAVRHRYKVRLVI